MTPVSTIENSYNTLEDALSFDGQEVVYKFMESYDVTFEEGEEIFAETLKWLWFANRIEGAFMDKPFLIIDKMWHTFILFTSLYTNYCNEKFGRFIHHAPSTKREIEKHKLKLAKNRKKTLEEAFVKAKRQYETVGDVFGFETQKKWYKLFPVKYSVERMNDITKKIS